MHRQSLLKAVMGMNHQEKKKRKPSTPEEETRYWCGASLEKNGLTVKYISDYKATGDHRKGDFLLEYIGGTFVFGRSRGTEEK
ncbi:hypothetical protein KUTeg_010632 [Tegillarca granosa]|uniref:Uncharacterized protein n=1 Tax=Tegillarca granosa TaxID=220873 RepID=A0ABQ9F3B1_TEGGR|nr:hypothetical protein KUTeg_010632 [Tegillarca granosa]